MRLNLSNRLPNFNWLKLGTERDAHATHPNRENARLQFYVNVSAVCVSANSRTDIPYLFPFLHVIEPISTAHGLFDTKSLKNAYWQ